MNESAEALYYIPPAKGDRGPFTAGQLRAYVDSGQVSMSTMATHADTGETFSVDAILASFDQFPDDAYTGQLRPNGLGKASFILSIISACFISGAFLLVIMSVASNRLPAIGLGVTVGAMVLHGGMIGLVSLILGIVGLSQANKKKGRATAGTAISAILTLFIVVLLIAG